MLVCFIKNGQRVGVPTFFPDHHMTLSENLFFSPCGRSSFASSSPRMSCLSLSTFLPTVEQPHTPRICRTRALVSVVGTTRKIKNPKLHQIIHPVVIRKSVSRDRTRNSEPPIANLNTNIETQKQLKRVFSLQDNSRPKVLIVSSAL